MLSRSLSFLSAILREFGIMALTYQNVVRCRLCRVIHLVKPGIEGSWWSVDVDTDA